jgi:hypothetical protein
MTLDVLPLSFAQSKRIKHSFSMDNKRRILIGSKDSDSANQQ